MKIQYFVFNYSRFTEAMKIFDSLSIRNCDTYLINCKSDDDPQFEETDRIRKFPNIYYSGQWNEALKLLTGDVIFIINSDVKVNSFDKLINKMENFYDKFGDKSGLYSPNHYWTPWTYNPVLLEDIGDGMKKVPVTDSTIWSVCADIAHKVGPMDLNVNKLGWGLEILSAYYCFLEDRLVVRDYSIKCDHPFNTSYDRNQADREWRSMIDKMGLNKLWDYYNSRNKYGFGWRGNDEVYLD